MSEAQTVNSSIPHLREALTRTAVDARRTVLRAEAYRLAWVWLAGVAALFGLDLLLGLPVWLRWLALLGQAGYVAWAVWRVREVRARLRDNADWAARIVEERHPGLDNALINAVQFERAVSGSDSPGLSSALMRREMERAEGAARELPSSDPVARDSERLALRRLLILGGGWLAVAVLFSGPFLAVAPRLFLPWLDDITPPFSLTRFDVRPPGARVRYGESLNVSVTVSGPLPDNLALMTRTRNAGWRRIALESADPGRYSVTLSSLQEETWFFVQGGGSRSARYRIRVVTPPRVLSLRAVYTFPKYTGRSPAAESLGEEGIHGLSGTRVALQVVSNRVLRNGELEVRTEDGAVARLPVRPDAKEPSHGTALLTLARPGTFRLGLTADGGQATPEAATGKITVDRDQRPVVWFSTPGQDLLVLPDMKVPLYLEADDDSAVQRVQVHRLVNELSDTPLDLPAAPAEPHFEHRFALDLADLGVRPGDEIKYYATAYDNDPARPNVGETEMFSIKVATPEEYRQALQERTPEEVTEQPEEMVQAAQDLAARQGALARKLEQLQGQLKLSPQDAALLKQLQQAQKEQKELADQALQLSDAMDEFSRTPSTSELERALKRLLKQLAQQMRQTANGPMRPQPPRTLQELAREAARQLSELSRQMQDRIHQAFAHLHSIYPLYHDLDRFMELIDRQGQLVLKAREFRDKLKASREDRARMEELQQEQARIADELKQLQADLRQHADEAAADFPKAAASARRIADEIDRRRVPDLMQDSQDRFRQWNGPEGFDRAQEALRQMEQMVQQVQGGQQTAEGELDLILSRLLGSSGLGQSLGQMGPGMGRSSGNGGSPNGQSGGSSAHSARAFIPGSELAQSSGGGGKRRSPNKVAGTPASLAPENVEVMKNPAQKPPKAAGTESGRYPPEYRKLIGEYFKAVAEGGG